MASISILGGEKESYSLSVSQIADKSLGTELSHLRLLPTKYAMRTFFSELESAKIPRVTLRKHRLCQMGIFIFEPLESPQN